MSFVARAYRFVLGPPRDPKEPGAFHRLSLIAFLAWVGLGADGLSSSAYGPEETFRQLGEHRELAVFLAGAMIVTVFVISYGYSRIIEQFPAGGGGYLVASKVLGPRAGVVSGSALLVDYVLTITISVAAGADAIFSFLPIGWHVLELPCAFVGVVLLVVLNLRGVKESVTTIAPVFALFIVTHAVLLAVAIGGHVGALPTVARTVREGVGESVSALGMLGTLKLLMHAYSLGGGTYTGIEAVSNGVGIMREPRVQTAKRTMALMATSLAVTASGLLLAYLLFEVAPVPGKTMNAVLLEAVAGDFSLFGVNVGYPFVVVALFSEGALLFVAAQAGFVDGPRVMANMAVDSWLPHRLSALSERLTMRNGIVLMGAAALAALLYTRGDVSKLVVMYAINVFVAFALSNFAMAVFWVRRRATEPAWLRHLPAHALAFLLSLSILLVTVVQKLTEGAWVTLLVTSLLVGFCFSVKRHYERVARAIRAMDEDLPGPEARPALYAAGASGPLRPPEPDAPVAVLLVGGYGGLGRHALLTLLRMFPGHFRGVVFVTVSVVDSDAFKGADEIPALEARSRVALEKYEQFARALDLPCRSVAATGTEVVAEAERLAQSLAWEYPRALVVAGQVVFEEETSFRRLLHNETAFAIQRRLQQSGIAMIVLPVQVRLREGPLDRQAVGRRVAAP
jgi:hypothetical protein